jgi:hypothetical protein
MDNAENFPNKQMEIIKLKILIVGEAGVGKV